MRLGRDFYRQDVYTLAYNLVGKVLCLNKNHHPIYCRLVETEAYGGATDKAAHSYNNLRTNRTEVMFWDGGDIYMYLIYGMYYLFNIVANTEGIPEAVLIRAAEPLGGEKLRLNGPGLFSQSLGLDKSFYGLDLSNNDRIFLIDDGYRPPEIVATKRINIDYAEEDKNRLWRFYIKGNSFISRK